MLMPLSFLLGEVAVVRVEEGDVALRHIAQRLEADLDQFRPMLEDRDKDPGRDQNKKTISSQNRLKASTKLDHFTSVLV